MRHIGSLLAVAVLGLTPQALSRAAEPVEPFLRDLKPGLFLRKTTAVPAAQTEAISRKLGGQIERLTNSILVVQGRPIQVNAITARDTTDAQAIFSGLKKFKSPPFILRNDRVVIEYVGSAIDEALAVKTSLELGLVQKPSQVRYRVRAELATIERADYMACNPLFGQFLAAGSEPTDEVMSAIQELAAKFTFGKSLVLRNPQLGPAVAAYQFEPAAASQAKHGAATHYTFAQPRHRHGVPFVLAKLEITANDSGLLADHDAPGPSLTAATTWWPADDVELIALAEKITSGAGSHEAKAMAILRWLTAGKNINYSGQTGSRWGTKKVLTQKFGHCWDFSDCFVTLCRAAGVPARQVAGWLYGSSGHVWAEFYREGRGWQQVDPTGGGQLRCGIYHIPYFTSLDGEMPIVYLSMPTIEVIAPE